jgi:hypothetical protein
MYPGRRHVATGSCCEIRPVEDPTCRFKGGIDLRPEGVGFTSIFTRLNRKLRSNAWCVWVRVDIPGGTVQGLTLLCWKTLVALCFVLCKRKMLTSYMKLKPTSGGCDPGPGRAC